MPVPVSSFNPTVPASPRGGVASSMPDLPAFKVVQPRDSIKVEDFRLPDGSPLVGPDGYLVPPAREFSMVVNAATRMYSYRFDEAMRDNWVQARAMRRDAFIRGLLEERILPTINRRWQLDVDDDRDPNQKTVRDGLTKIVEALPQFDCFKRALLDGVWYGRAGTQWNYFRNPEVNDLWSIKKWDPVHGDSIQFTYDGVPAILMDAMTAGWYASNGATQGQWGDLRSTDRGGQALVLQRPTWRNRFAIHQHIREKADYFEGELAGSVQGLGLRGLVYWQYLIRTDALTWMLAYMQSVGQMDMLIFNYPWSDAAAKAQQQANANKIIGKAAFIVPRNPQGNWQAVEQLSMNDAGLKALHDLISEYFDRHIERLIVGQSMSAGADNESGLGGSGRADFAKATKDEILVYDSNRLDEVMTSDVIKPLKQYNFKWARFPVRFKSVLPNLDAEKKVASGKTMVELKVPIKMDELREAAGFSRPEEGDEVVQPPPDPNAGPMGMGGPPGAPPSLSEPGQLPQPGQTPPEGGSPVLTPNPTPQPHPPNAQPSFSSGFGPSFNSRQPTSYVTDATGHEHKGSGPGGGQFTSSSGGSSSSAESTEKSDAAGQIREKYKGQQASNEPIREYMEAHGLTLDDYHAANKALYAHNIASTPEAANRIISLWNSQEPAGQALRLMSAWNEWQVENDQKEAGYVGQPFEISAEDQAWADKKRETWNDPRRNFMVDASVTQTPEDWLRLQHAKETGQYVFYRKGEFDKPVISMTTDPKGANTGTGRFKPDRFRTYDDMKRDGYVLLAGSRGMVGMTSAREQEYIWLKVSQPVHNASSQSPTRYVTDRSGHDHKGKGPGGGQFTSGGTSSEAERRGYAPLKSASRGYTPTVDGREVLPDVSNTSSIGSSVEDPEVLPGLYEIPMSAFDPAYKPRPHSTQERQRLDELKAAISHNKQISPLIVVIDDQGPYVLEGGHRFDALHEMGAKSFPAMVVIDKASAGEDPDGWKWSFAPEPTQQYDAAPAPTAPYFPGGSNTYLPKFDKTEVGFTRLNRGQDPTLYGEHKLGCVMVPLTGQAAIELLGRANLVRDCDLADDGREESPHVTVRFGFKPEVTTGQIEAALRGKGPFELTLGKVSCFYGEDSGKDYDVLKVDVTSPQLKALHSILGGLPNEATHKDYKPHATIAYVKAGLGREYMRLLAPLDLKVVVDELEYSDADKARSYFKLRGVGTVPGTVPAATQYSQDAHGNEHKDSGPGGGQFTSQGGGSPTSQDEPSEEPSLAPPNPISPVTASVLSRLPRTAYERLSSRVTKLTEAPTVEAVTDAWYAGEPNPPPPGRRTPCYGFYDPASGELVTGPGGPNVDQRGVIAHEVGHALDQSDDRRHFDLSGHPEFVQAWRAEMSRGQLSNYARTDEVEGFAEACRLLYGTEGGAETFRNQFPRCHAYFRRVGLAD